MLRMLLQASMIARCGFAKIESKLNSGAYSK
jgi:hypothetical protein